MVTYKQIKDRNGKISDKFIIKNNEWVVPFDPDNTDYQQYLKWVEAGNQPEPAEEV